MSLVELLGGAEPACQHTGELVSECAMRFLGGIARSSSGAGKSSEGKLTIVYPHGAY